MKQSELFLLLAAIHLAPHIGYNGALVTSGLFLAISFALYLKKN
jgi:inner membrane protein involved in colicin E2 resistance